MRKAELDALDDLLDDLRMNGEYAQLAARAKTKLDCEAQERAPAEIVRAEQAALRWYFTEQRGTTEPDDLAEYAQSCGFPDEQAFRRAVRHEYSTAAAGDGQR